MTPDEKYRKAIRYLEKAMQIWDGKVKEKYELAEKYFSEAKYLADTFLLTEEEENLNPF